MFAASFIAFSAGHIAMLAGGVALGLICLGAAWLCLTMEDQAGLAAVAFVGFALFFFVGLGVVFPHTATVDGRHHVQVFRDLPAEYGNDLVVVGNSVNDHWVDFKLPQCGSHVYRYGNMRLIGGNYWFATTVVDKYGDENYRPISASALTSLCQTATVVG